MQISVLTGTGRTACKYVLLCKTIVYVIVFVCLSCVLTCEHGLEVVAGQGHDDSVDTEGFVTVARNQDHVTKGLVHPEPLKALQEEKPDECRKDHPKQQMCNFDTKPHKLYFHMFIRTLLSLMTNIPEAHLLRVQRC